MFLNQHFRLEAVVLTPLRVYLDSILSVQCDTIITLNAHIDEEYFFDDTDKPKQEWWLDGKRHREDGPAVIYCHGEKEWFVHGVRHREDGPAVESGGRGQVWFNNGVRHWLVDGKLHRADGPAIENPNCNHKEWWYMGARLSEEGYKAVTRSN